MKEGLVIRTPTGLRQLLRPSIEMNRQIRAPFRRVSQGTERRLDLINSRGHRTKTRRSGFGSCSAKRVRKGLHRVQRDQATDDRSTIRTLETC